MNKNNHVAKSVGELQNVLFSASANLKTQVLASPLLKHPQCKQLKMRLDEIAGELQELQMDAAMTVPQYEPRNWLHMLRRMPRMFLKQKSR